MAEHGKNMQLVNYQTSKRQTTHLKESLYTPKNTGNTRGISRNYLNIRQKIDIKNKFHNKSQKNKSTKATQTKNNKKHPKNPKPKKNKKRKTQKYIGTNKNRKPSCFFTSPPQPIPQATNTVATAMVVVVPNMRRDIGSSLSLEGRAVVYFGLVS